MTANRQRGLTLIEILVTLVLLSILVFGLTGLWSNVSGHFLSLTLRQKAVFVLSGEMDRLSALYRFTNFSADAPDSDNSSSPPAQQYDAPALRKIFPVTSTNAPVVDTIVTQDGATFDCGTNDCAARIFYDANGSGSNDDRVYVWIDQARKFTGRLSWVHEELVGIPNSANCSDGVSTVDGTAAGEKASCRNLTVYLEYPFRFIDGTTPDAPAGFDKIHQLSLKTIVGRRQ